MSMNSFLKTVPYNAPEWTAGLAMVPKERMILAMVPTPIHRWTLPDMPSDVELFIKRDDMTGSTLSGNKVRKLEFLMADAMKQNITCVVTMGSLQSNHCRAVAVASRYLGLDSHLILRCRTARDAEQDPGVDGNLLAERMVGTYIHQITKEDCRKKPSNQIIKDLADRLRTQGHRPYEIPIGGSNALGAWGYVNAIKEIIDQTPAIEQYTDFVVATGSGGTVAGLVLGIGLSGLNIKLHAYAVCDTPEYFYDEVTKILSDLGALEPLPFGSVSLKKILTVEDAKGMGYGINRPDEFEFLKEVSTQTGIILDPVYTGKAVHGFHKDLKENPEKWRGKRILYIHTGGLLSIYGSTHEVAPLVKELNRIDHFKIDD